MGHGICCIRSPDPESPVLDPFLWKRGGIRLHYCQLPLHWADWPQAGVVKVAEDDRTNRQRAKDSRGPGSGRASDSNASRQIRGSFERMLVSTAAR